MMLVLHQLCDISCLLIQMDFVNKTISIIMRSCVQQSYTFSSLLSFDNEVFIYYYLTHICKYCLVILDITTMNVIVAVRLVS